MPDVGERRERRQKQCLYELVSRLTVAVKAAAISDNDEGETEKESSEPGQDASNMNESDAANKADSNASNRDASVELKNGSSEQVDKGGTTTSQEGKDQEPPKPIDKLYNCR
eukprot:766195-Hanusia_phi.AAC.6